MTTMIRTLKSVSRTLAGARVGIPPRQLRFSFPHESPQHYVFHENPLGTALLVTLSGVFPAGERWFVESVRRFRDQITDETLKAQVSGFIGQEAIHSREHERLNAHHEARGFDTQVPDRLVRLGLRILDRFSPTQQLACTCFMEHATAMLAEGWLTNETLHATSDPEMMRLWYWHALEELEHKSVAYDVWKHVSDKDHERAVAMAAVLAFIIPQVFIAWMVLWLRDDQRFDGRKNRDALVFLFQKNGFLRNVFEGMPAFVRKGFHPSQNQTTELEAFWRNQLFGEQGELQDFVTH